MDSDGVERLSVATPIYSDLSGECFGMALIETDIARQIEEVLLGLGGVECEVFVSDGEGGLWASSSPEDGVRVATAGQAINGLPPEFVSRMGEQGLPFEIKQDYEYHRQTILRRSNRPRHRNLRPTCAVTQASLTAVPRSAAQWSHPSVRRGSQRR